MTQKLTELFNLPPAEDVAEPERVETSSDIDLEENKALLAEVDNAIDKIDAALPMVKDLSASDNELDELADLAKNSAKDLIDLGMNVEARFSGHILATAGTLLGHAISAKQAKLDKKLRMVDLQLKKARFDWQVEQAEKKTDGERIVDAEDGQGVVMDRNELLKQLLNKK